MSATRVGDSIEIQRSNLSLESLWLNQRLGVALAGIALIALTVLVYAPFLTVGFAATDSLPLVETSRFSTVGEALALFTRPVMSGTSFAANEVVYRPFVSFTFGLDYAMWRLDAIGYHVTNLGLHLVGVVGVWWLLSGLGLRAWSSFAGAALFAFHPLVVASVPVIARRDSVLPVAASVIGAALVLSAEQVRGRGRIVRLVLALIAVAIGLFSKESAFLATLMLPVLVAFARVGQGRALSLWRVVPFVLLMIVVLIVRTSVLRAVGGPSSLSELTNVDLDRYSQVLGAFTRDLAWPFAWIASSTREIWPRLAIGVLVALTVALFFLPRRQAWPMAAGIVWLAGFFVFSMVLKITTVGWLSYFALVGVAIVFAAGMEGAVMRMRERHWRLISGTLFAGLAVYAVSAFSASALVRSYPQWQVAGDVIQRFDAALVDCARSAPQATHVSLRRVPLAYEDGRFETQLMGVTLMEDYTAESALHLAFPERPFVVEIKDWETLRAGPDTLSFGCSMQGTDSIELTTSY